MFGEPETVMGVQMAESIDSARRARGETKAIWPIAKWAVPGLLLLVVFPCIELLFFTKIVNLDTYFIEEGQVPRVYDAAGEIYFWFFRSWGVYGAMGLVVTAMIVFRRIRPGIRNYFALGFLLFALVWSILLGYAIFIAAHSIT